METATLATTESELRAVMGLLSWQFADPTGVTTHGLDSLCALQTAPVQDCPNVQLLIVAVPCRNTL